MEYGPVETTDCPALVSMEAEAYVFARTVDQRNLWSNPDTTNMAMKARLAIVWISF